MANYFNQVIVGVSDLARLNFTDVVNGESDIVAELACPVEMLPIIADTLRNTYEEYKKRVDQVKADRQTNKMLS